MSTPKPRGEIAEVGLTKYQGFFTAGKQSIFDTGSISPLLALTHAVFCRDSIACMQLTASLQSLCTMGKRSDKELKAQKREVFRKVINYLTVGQWQWQWQQPCCVQPRALLA